MAHFTRVNGTWVDGVPLDPTWLPGFDQRQFDAVNGVDGGTYGPSADITIGGFGLRISGPMVVFGSTGLVTGLVHLGTGEWPHLGATHSARTRKLVQPLVYARQSIYPEFSDLSLVPTLPPLLLLNAHYRAAQFAATDVIDQQNDTTYAPALTMPLRVVDACILSQVEFRFRVATPRTQAPITMPRFRVVRRSAVDGSTVYLQSTAAGADENGWASPPLPTSGAAWYAGGNAQSFVYVCDQHRVIDKSEWVYFVEIIEESGQTDPPLCIIRASDVVGATEPTGAGATKHPLKMGANLSGSTVDTSVTLSAGNRVLAVTGTNLSASGETKALAGIYVLNESTGFAERDPLFEAKPGTIVRVAGGFAYAGAYFQLQSKDPIVLGVTPLDFKAAPFEPFIGSGNIYHSAVTTFTGITDTRWQ